METSYKKTVKKVTTPEQREAIIESWKESGRSKKEFCSESGINYCTFISWLTPGINKNKTIKIRKDGTKIFRNKITQ